jgi:hypothetical protein
MVFAGREPDLVASLGLGIVGGMEGRAGSGRRMEKCGRNRRGMLWMTPRIPNWNGITPLFIRSWNIGLANPLTSSVLSAIQS